MNHAPTHPPRLQDEPEEFCLCADDLPLLSGSITLPCWDARRARRFARYYRACADGFRRTCRTVLFPQAEEAFHRAVESGGPLPQWQATLSATFTLQRPHLVSLHTDTVVTGMPRRSLARQGDTWDLRSGLLLSLPECFPPRAPWRHRLLAHARSQIAGWEEQGVARYHDGWQRLLPRAFSPHRFYLTAEGLCFFFPADSIAPLVEGIPTFCVAYDEEKGPFIPE